MQVINVDIFTHHHSLARGKLLVPSQPVFFQNIFPPAVQQKSAGNSLSSSLSLYKYILIYRKLWIIYIYQGHSQRRRRVEVSPALFQKLCALVLKDNNLSVFSSKRYLWSICQKKNLQKTLIFHTFDRNINIYKYIYTSKLYYDILAFTI